MGAPENGAASTEPGPGGVAKIVPAPVPTSVGVMPIPDAQVVAFVMTTPVGRAWYFVTPDAARNIADSLKMAAQQAAIGLTIAQPGDVPPPPAGL